MSPEEMMLNLVCLDKGIIQLNDIRCVQKQFDALDPEERRKAARKIRKLAKKYISKSSRGVDKIFCQKMLSAGFGQEAPRSRKDLERYNRIKILYARRLLMELINDQKNRR